MTHYKCKKCNEVHSVSIKGYFVYDPSKGAYIPDPYYLEKSSLDEQINEIKNIEFDAFCVVCDDYTFVQENI